MNKKQLGQFGEKLAQNYYQKLGYQLIAKNIWTPGGEIDLLFTKDQKIFIVEVKTRKFEQYGWPEETVNLEKIKHLKNAWSWWQRQNHCFNKIPNIEVCSISIQGKQAKIKRFLI